MQAKFAALAALVAVAQGQLVGSETAETHPKMTWQKCTTSGCTNVNAEVTIDSNWRWLHAKGGYTNCYDGNEWNTTACSDAEACAANCEIEGADYGKTYGASTSGNALTLKFLTKHEYGTNIGSRFYLMNGVDKYQMFTLQNNEFTFDVDLSTLDCGLNGALYFVSMDEDGGLAKYSSNKAGAKYGTGYCDAQCARDLKFVGGKANSDGWKPSSNDDNAGVGPYGACCAEMDVWESNAHSFAVTPHPCKNNAYHVCENDGCGGTYSENRFNGDCDPNGCDYNPYRQGNKDFYGAGKTLDTTKLFTVVTQWTKGKIVQFFVQGGKKIEYPDSTWPGVEGHELTDEWCEAAIKAFDDTPRFNEVGGMAQMDDAVEKGMVLVMSLWDDHYSNMLWLDSSYPPEKAGTPGGDRGDCAQDSGVPKDVEANQASAQVIYSNIRFGPIGTTVKV